MALVMKMILSHKVPLEDDSKTIRFILKGRLGLSEKLVKKLKYAGQILCNSMPVHVNACVRSGDIIEVIVRFDEANDEIIPENIPLDIVYEDECMIAVNKQPGIVVHPTSYHPSGTVANALVHYLLRKGVRSTIRPVSRLDRDTSGIIVFAGNQYIQESLIKQMRNRTYIKEYVGIVHGIVGTASGTIDLPIERKPGSIMLRHVSASGAASVTHFEVIEFLNGATFLKFTLETGRTHQIRVHCQAIGHPLIGDTLYPFPDSENAQTPESLLIGRQALHSLKTAFIHPLNGSPVELVAPVPADMLNALEILKK